MYSWRFCRFDLRPRRDGPPGRPNAPAAPPRPPPDRGRPPPPPRKPPPPAGAPPPPPPGPPRYRRRHRRRHHRDRRGSHRHRRRHHRDRHARRHRDRHARRHRGHHVRRHQAATGRHRRHRPGGPDAAASCRGSGRGGICAGRGPADRTGALPPRHAGRRAGRPLTGTRGALATGRHRPGRGPAGRGDGAPAPTPNGLLPTRGARGPGLGDCVARRHDLAAACPPPVDCWLLRLLRSRRGGLCRRRLGRRLGLRRPSPPRAPEPARPAGPDAGFAAAGLGAACAASGAGGRGLCRGLCLHRGRRSAPPAPGRPPAGCAAGFGRGPLRVPPPLFAPPSAEGYASRSRRATGASTVEDADFTNSPCSLSFARTSLLVTPSSFASSCTRALPATALLVRVRPAAWSRATSSYCLTFMASASRLTHDGSTCFRSSSPAREDPGPVTR